MLRGPPLRNQVRGPNTVTYVGSAGPTGTFIIQQIFERPNDVTTNDTRTTGIKQAVHVPATSSELTSHISDYHQGGLPWTSADIKKNGLVSGRLFSRAGLSRHRNAKHQIVEGVQTPTAIDAHAAENSLSLIEVDELYGDYSTITAEMLTLLWPQRLNR